MLLLKNGGKIQNSAKAPASYANFDGTIKVRHQCFLTVRPTTGQLLKNVFPNIALRGRQPGAAAAPVAVQSPAALNDGWWQSWILF